MKVFIAGIDGYLGWPLALYLNARGHSVAGIDNGYRRLLVREMGGGTITPIQGPIKRKNFARNMGIEFEMGDACGSMVDRFKKFKPDAIVHLAEIPSAPYSMAGFGECWLTFINNSKTTLNILWAMKDVCPEAHLVKLGTMGEYGTPDIDIPEGHFPVEFRNRLAMLPFPRQPGSFYHATKCADSINVELACKLWGLRSTDVMQGVVFGTRTDEMGNNEKLLTRFDIDECFGTAINRFCAQAVIEHPITVYGKGMQKRGFIPLRDSMQCLGIAIENPPEAGEYRVFNQFEGTYTLVSLARRVERIGASLGLKTEINYIENPRIEEEKHYYNPDCKELPRLGYRPTRAVTREITSVLQDLMKYKDRIEKFKDRLIPEVRWDGTKRKSERL